MTFRNVLLTLNFYIYIIFTLSSDIVLNISENNHFFPFKHFWKSTGFCPPDPKENVPDYLLSKEQRTHLALIGALPNQGIQYVRIHWLLNLLALERNSEYNFTNMDIFVNVLQQSGLRPGFEIMGCKSELVDFDKNKIFWKNLSKQIASRYIEYFDYVVGCNEGLKSAFSALNLSYNFGGPAGLFRDKNHPLCWGILEFCSSASVDLCSFKYISFHRKGGGSASGVLNGSLEAMDRIFDKFPKLKTFPVSNDEADIETNWSKSLEWRGDVRYAYMVAKVIADYYKSVKRERKLKIELLGNDNGFLNYHPFYFTQRTLFARFQVNTTTPPHNQFIKKPVYSLMALLSFLGESWILTPTQPSPDPLLTTIATRSVTQHKQAFVSVLVAYGNESYDDNSQANRRNISLKIEGFEVRDWKFIVYKLDNIETNPFKVWRKMGSPVFPDQQQRYKMREVEDPKRLFTPTDVLNSEIILNLSLSIPSVHLIHVCSKTEKLPRKVTAVRFYNVTWNEVLITWKYPYNDSKCLQKFEVELKPSKCSNRKSSNSSRHRRFERINPLDTIFMSFHQVGKGGNELCEGTRGTYRVRAVDYWDRVGKFSEIMPYP
ncbi:alpha-L-iduronidase isoform X2 [Diorhabda sublineata]|uniref:alpha-L-iduronidase isoform X2 n=1 Tax=Diorhabda sublineata TaxID=1163346 RepID=UPI0024E1613C|nr:alpha-L-iduronidase isoform X2 [Diorhabda sublineata]